MKESLLEWQPLKKKTVFSTRIFDVNELLSRSPDKRDHVFYSLNASDWVIVVPITRNDAGEECFLLVRQWRHGVGEESLEFPGGVMNDGETPEEAAGRELLEETGYRPGILIHGATVSPNPAIMENHCHIYLAENMENTEKCNPDDDEYISKELIPVRRVIDSMGKPPYIHALMLSALFTYIQKKGLPA